MIPAKLSRRLAPLNDTNVFREKGYEFYRKMVRAAEKAKFFSKLPKTYRKAVLAAEKELK